MAAEVTAEQRRAAALEVEAADRRPAVLLAEAVDRTRAAALERELADRAPAARSARPIVHRTAEWAAIVSATSRRRVPPEEHWAARVWADPVRARAASADGRVWVVSAVAVAVAVECAVEECGAAEAADVRKLLCEV